MGPWWWQRKWWNPKKAPFILPAWLTGFDNQIYFTSPKKEWSGFPKIYLGFLWSLFFFRYFSFLKKNIFAKLYSQCSWIKWDKSVSKRLGCGQFCLRYFRQVLTHSMLFQPSRKSCFSRYLSKKCIWAMLCQNWLSNCYEKYILAYCACTVINFVHFSKSLCACWWSWVGLQNLGFRF